MKRFKRRILAVGILSAGMLAGVAMAEDQWVKSDNVQIRSGKGAVYPVIATPKMGDKLNVTAHDGKWLKVTVKDANGNDEDGYVYGDALSPDKVGSGGNLLAGLGVGNDTSSMSTGAAAKGLNPEAETYASGKKLNSAAMNKLIAQRKQLDPKKWEAFVAEGKVGPDAPSASN